MNRIVHKSLKKNLSSYNRKVGRVRKYASKIYVDTQTLGGHKLIPDFDRVEQRLKDRGCLYLTQKEKDFLSVIKLCVTCVDNCNHHIGRNGDIIPFDRYRFFFYISHIVVSDYESELLTDVMLGLEPKANSELFINIIKDRLMTEMAELGFSGKHIWLARMIFNLYFEGLSANLDFNLEDTRKLESALLENYPINYVLL